MTTQPHTTPIQALIAKVDAVLRTTGTDPDTVTEGDKIMLAAQYIEVEAVLGILDSHRETRLRL